MWQLSNTFFLRKNIYKLENLYQEFFGFELPIVQTHSKIRVSVL